MILTGKANMVGFKSGTTKNGGAWCSVVFDALDDPLERVQYFVPDDLVEKVKKLEKGEVIVEVRIYPVKDGAFGSRLLDVYAA